MTHTLNKILAVEFFVIDEASGQAASRYNPQGLINFAGFFVSKGLKVLTDLSTAAGRKIKNV